MKKLTENHKRKISIWHVNNKNSKKYKERNKKISNKLKGRKHPMKKETKKKLSIYWKNKLKDKTKHNMYGKHHTEKTKTKMRNNHRKFNSEKEKLKTSKTMRKFWTEKKKDKKFMKEFREKISCPRPNSQGKKHWNWRNGSSFKSYSSDWKNTLKQSIRQRDSFKCKICNKSQQKNYRKLDVHHIDYNKQNCNPNNLITLCMRCHRKTQTNRNKWIIYFKKECKLM